MVDLKACGLNSLYVVRTKRVLINLDYLVKNQEGVLTKCDVVSDQIACASMETRDIYVNQKFRMYVTMQSRSKCFLFHHG